MTNEMGQIHKEVKNFDSSQFECSIKIYESSFPPYETRPTEKVVEMLENGCNYHLFVSLDNRKVIGISLMYTMSDLGIGLLDYIAVTSEKQRKGIGTQLFNYTLKKFKSYVHNGIGLLMEIQKENGRDRQESVARKKRICFYMRLGAKILGGVNYLLPPLQHGVEAEEMYLMLRPLVDISHLSRESVVRYIEAIYLRIYQ
jgi:GNAT superfamily N-acetyltransferase